MAKGKVYLIGAGPGRPDLITVRGLNVLGQADVIIYDYLIDKKMLEATKPDALLICSDEFGKKRFSDGFTYAQERINHTMVKHALSGKKVVRLKNGDPMIFSRITQELDALAKNGIEFEIVPGVTASTAGAAYSGTPLTDRRFSSSVVFVTGHEGSGKEKSLIDWEAVSRISTIVFFMAVENLKKIAGKLITCGRKPATPALIISKAGSPGQKTVRGTLLDIADRSRKAGLRAPAILIIGDVISSCPAYDWYEKNKKILFTELSDERYFLKGGTAL